MVVKLRHCTRCGQDKPDADFYETKNIVNACIACMAATNKLNRWRQLSDEDLAEKISQMWANLELIESVRTEREQAALREKALEIGMKILREREG